MVLVLPMLLISRYNLNLNNNMNFEFDNELVSCRQLASYQLLLIGELMFIINAGGRESFQNKISNWSSFLL